jgi:magnesium chelatase subunit I
VAKKSIENERPVFPFTAIIGQEEMKLALILNIIDPGIGGVMIMGDRGTGKSTTIRAVADLLPAIKVVANDPFNSLVPVPGSPVFIGFEAEKYVYEYKKIPMVDLPLGASEDRVCGTIDIEKALTDGVKSFEPGLLAKANRGILYVDEVNLLDDHLVDILLDSAASGWNTVEREGISVKHPARFVLVGSGNPEEGELRPQLLDRFGMHAEICTERNPEMRVRIVEERSDFDKDPIDFLQVNKQKLDVLRQSILDAKEIFAEVQITYDLRVKISKVCSALNVDGLRGDIVTNRAAKAFAAYNGRTQVTVKDIATIIVLCLRHRLRCDPLQQSSSGNQVLDVFNQVFA